MEKGPVENGKEHNADLTPHQEGVFGVLAGSDFPNMRFPEISGTLG